MAFESSWSTRALAPVPKPKPRKKKSSHWYDGITGFIGHLGGDVRDAVVGIPMGVVSLFKDPIKSVKVMGQASWHDWSPLFHGDVREFAERFYEHPLAPILDVVSVATLGVGSGARVAGGLAKAAGKPTGKLARFADPGKAALAASTQRHLAQLAGPSGKLGVKSKGVQQLAERRAMLEPEVQAAFGRRVTTKGGVVAFRAYQRNPLLRARAKGVARLGEKAAQSDMGKRLGVQNVMGNAAFAKRWEKMDVSRRQTAAVVMQQRELAAIHKLGKTLSGLTMTQLFDNIEGTMRNGIVHQAHEVEVGPNFKQQIKALQAEGYTLLKDDSLLDRKFVNKFLAKNTDKGLADALRVWGKDQTTNQLQNAKKGTRDGTVLVVSGKASSKLAREAANSSRAAKLFYKHPTTVWKWMVLAASPRYFVNNVVGNSLMLAMSGNPVVMSRALANHVRTLHGAKRADRLLTDVERAQKMVTGPEWTAKIYAGEHQGWGGSELRDISQPGRVGTKIPRRVREGLFPVTHRASDTGHRAVAMNYAMMRTPEYQAAYGRLRGQGVGHIQAHTRAAETASHSPRVRDYVREQVNHVLGQYHHFTKFERQVKNVVPFYAWDRAITRHTADMVMNRPYQAAMVAAIGTRGTEATEDILGQIPDFLKGAIPLDAGGVLEKIAGKAPGRKNILMTQGINPYATIGDLTETAMSATGLTGDQRIRMGESLGGQLNPVLGSLIEAVSGSSMVSGAPIEPQPGGLLGNLYFKTLRNTPQVKLGESLVRKYAGHELEPSDPSKPFLFKKGVRPDLSSFLGVPMRAAKPSKVSELYRRQHGILKGRKRAFPELSSTGSAWKRSSELPGL